MQESCSRPARSGRYWAPGWSGPSESKDAWLLVIFGSAGFIVLIALAFALNLPVYLVIVNTAVAGASVLIAGLLLLVNRVDDDDLDRGTAVSAIDDSRRWILGWSVLAGMVMPYQLSMRASIRLPEERWVTGSTRRRTSTQQTANCPCPAGRGSSAGTTAAGPRRPPWPEPRDGPGNSCLVRP